MSGVDMLEAATYWLDVMPVYGAPESDFDQWCEAFGGWCDEHGADAVELIRASARARLGHVS